MHRLTVKAVISLAVSANLSILLAATSAIGVVTSNGNIILNDARTAANATVFDGSTLQTESIATKVRFNSGAQLQLGSESRGKLYSDRVVLEKGSARIDGYSANANGLKITADSSSSASVSLQGATVQVAALTGNVHVYNAYGINVANLAPGKALNLTPQDAGASAATTMIGTIKKSGGATLLTDETSNVTVELRGGSFKAGDRVQVTGTPVAGAKAAAGASQVIQVSNSKKVGGAAVGAAGGNEDQDRA